MNSRSKKETCCTLPALWPILIGLEPVVVIIADSFLAITVLSYLDGKNIPVLHDTFGSLIDAVTENVELIETPLHDAAKRGNLNFLKECLNNGVSVNSLDKAGNTALYWASHTGHLECLIPLLQSPNIDLNVQVISS